MRLQDELKEKEALYEQLKADLDIHFPKGIKMDFALASKHVSMATRLIELETDISRINEAIWNHNPHDDYWEVIEYCIDHDIDQNTLMEFIRIAQS